MRVLVTADWHIGISQYGVLDKDGRNSRLSDVEDILMRIINFGIKSKVDLFVCTGDIFHTNRPTPEEQRIFWRILCKLEDSPMISRFIIGNHDHNSKLGASHALKLFKDIADSGFKRVRIYDETAWEDFADQGQQDPLLICFYPYHASPPDWSEMMKFGQVHATALVCHSHLEGAVVGAEPFEIKDDKATKFSDLPVDFVWAGHFHKPQVLCDRPIAFYPGSPHAVDFNERHDIKGVVVVDTINRSFEPIGFETRRFIQIDLDGTSVLSEKDLREVEEAVVKVNVTLDEAVADQFDENKIREVLISRDVHSIASINLQIVRQEVKRNPEIKLDSDLKSNFLRYLNDKSHGAHADDVRTKGLEIIEQCAS